MSTTKKTETGHEGEAYGFRWQTEQEQEGKGPWSVRITQKPRVAGLTPVLVEFAEGFAFEGEAIDHAQDWTMSNRPYIPEVQAAGSRGFFGRVLNESGYADYQTTEVPNGDEAQALVDSWIAAKRLHDQKVIAERRRIRADARMLEGDYHEIEAAALESIEKAKGQIEQVKKSRAQLRKDLACPQMDFNFVAELQRVQVQTLRRRGKEQTDLEKHIAAKTKPAEQPAGTAP